MPSKSFITHSLVMCSSFFSKKGHLYCRECILMNILDQKKEIEKRKQIKSVEKKKKEEEQKILDAEKQFEVAEEFRRQQESLSFSCEKETVDDSTALSSKAFWIPTATPSATSSSNTESSNTDKVHVICPRGNHPLSLKLLLDISFSFADRKEICPVCCKELSNNVDPAVLSACGHVICKSCSSNMKELEDSCLVCDKKHKGFIAIETEGTGFSSKGSVEAQKFDVAFQ